MRVIPLCALGMVLAAAGCSRHPFEHFFASGERYLGARQYSEAAIEFQNAARLDPRSIAAQVKLGETYGAMGQASDAAVSYARACALDERVVANCLQAAAAFLAIGDYDNAAVEARAVLAADSFNLDAQLLLVSALTGVRRFAEAEDRIQAALASVPTDPRAYRVLAELETRRGNTLVAEGAWRHAIALGPSNSSNYVDLANLYFDTGRPKDATRELRSALKANPDDVDANRAYGSYLVSSAQCEDAEEYWKKVAAGSTDESGTIALADYYMWSHRPDDALKVLEPVAKEPQRAEAQARIASIFYDRGDRPNARRVVDGVLQQGHGTVSALVLRARMSLDDHDPSAARSYLQKAATLDPNAAAVRDLLATLPTRD